jgi:hypothetical protein
LYLQLFLKGVLIPEKPHVLEAYMADKLRKLISIKFPVQYPPHIRSYITLFSRFMTSNSLVKRSALRFVMPKPVTRELLDKFA